MKKLLYLTALIMLGTCAFSYGLTISTTFGGPTLTVVNMTSEPITVTIPIRTLAMSSPGIPEYWTGTGNSLTITVNAPSSGETSNTVSKNASENTASFHVGMTSESIEVNSANWRFPLLFLLSYPTNPLRFSVTKKDGTVWQIKITLEFIENSGPKITVEETFAVNSMGL